MSGFNLFLSENIDLCDDDGRIIGSSPAQSVPYSAPSWQYVPPDDDSVSSIEVILNGTNIATIRLVGLKNKTFLSVGRFAPCEIQVDHPTVSHHHCVLQYGNLIGKLGWYLYDLGSTHGTRLNKQTVKKRCYTPLRPGYVFEFAENVKEREEMIEPFAKSQAMPTTSGKDIEEEKSKDDKKYYEQDPIGWLNKYFEREGIKMTFDYGRAEKGVEWLCSIELPDVVDGRLICASGLTRNLAQYQCAFLACQRLDTAGLLRNVSMWNDYYTSDEDLYDRADRIIGSQPILQMYPEAVLVRGTEEHNDGDVAEKVEMASTQPLSVCRTEDDRFSIIIISGQKINLKWWFSVFGYCFSAPMTIAGFTQPPPIRNFCFAIGGSSFCISTGILLMLYRHKFFK